MANPRNTVEYTGIAQRRVTHLVNDVLLAYNKLMPGGSLYVGRAVRFNANKSIGLSADGQPVHGRLEVVEGDGKAVITSKGFAEFPGGNAAALTPGSKIVGALDAGAVGGCIRNVAAATLAEVAVANHAIVDASDPTKVMVEM
jgi:hypothetical protein